MPAPAQTSTAAIVAAGRRLLEERGTDALIMRDVADAVGVRTPSLYKRVRNRSDLVRLILEDVTDELTAATDAAVRATDEATDETTAHSAAADLRALMAVYRGFAHTNPVAYTLLTSPQAVAGATERAERASATLLRLVAQVAGPHDALPAARTLVAWANGFITMELAGAFQLGGDVEQAWHFGMERVLTAIQREPRRHRPRQENAAPGLKDA
ncbi:TetR/AcrR family transcriptional regulator [Streptomyces sp. NPDC093085]|uniref:TetR/AcrR family transcriptional regulator n=1 Tax=Streptomyces sp. NPDC093085 TaxID=3155068 RepID=UPI0034162E46